MEKVYSLVVILFTGLLSQAQNPGTISSASATDKAVTSNTIDTIPVKNTAVQPARSMYGELLDDDPVYNPRYPWWQPAARVVAADVFNWALARYVYKFDWASNGPEDWKLNLKRKGEFDHDGFGINFIGHPHTGNYYYNIARSNGYSYLGSFPFAVGGSFIWEYFGENTRPSYNDLINTPISGAFLGEILYRLSSNVLDDRTRGAERVFREIFGGILNPPRALSRLTQGKMFRHTDKEVYQKEPLNMTFNGGAHRINNFDHFGTGATNAILNIQLDYGSPFEVRKRKPFDVFRFRTELSYGNQRKLLENVNGYGLLLGRTVKPGRLLVGLFQHFDYWNNNVFEVGTLGFGGGLIARLPVARHSNIYSTLHLAAVPLAGNNTQYGPDTSSFRHYNFGGGFQVKAEETFNLNDWASIGFQGFLYWIHTYDGIPGNSLVGLFKPSVNFKIYKNLSIGFEHLLYQNDRYLQDIPHLHLTRTEQKVYLQLYLEDPKRRGKYH